jgi:hypothetical protein
MEAKGASPERKADLKSPGRTGSQESVWNGRPRALNAGVSRHAAGRGRRGRTGKAGSKSGGRRKPNERGDRPEGGFKGASRRVESPLVHRPEEIGRHERRGPQGKRREWRNKPQADAEGLEEGREPGNRPEGHPETQGVSPADEGRPKACQRVGLGTARGRKPERWTEAGQRAGRRAGRRRESNARPEGSRRVERKRGAQALSRSTA